MASPAPTLQRKQTTLDAGAFNSKPREALTADLDCFQPHMAAGGLSALSQTLAHTPPRFDVGRVGRLVCLLVVLGFAAASLYLVVRELKGAQAPEQSFIRDAARIRPDAPRSPTGEPYWDALLGYTGLPKRRRQWG